jgi:hypothetical protein
MAELPEHQRAHGWPPIPPSLPPLLLLLRRAGVWTGEWIPLRRLGLGVPRGSRRRLLIAVGRAGYVDDREVLGGAGRAATARP